ncbi:MAG: DUF6776 family protein [Pseudomonadota bacterium]
MKLVIRPYRPVRRFAVAGLVVLLLAAMLAVVFDYGHWSRIAGEMIATGEMRTLLQENRELRANNDDLGYELTKKNRALQVAEIARGDNHAEMVNLETELSDLKEELRFYREIMASTNVGETPTVRGVSFHPTGHRDHYRYRFVLTYLNKDDSVAKGRLKAVVHGATNGRLVTFDIVEGIDGKSDSLDFEFKHFRLFEGFVQLPSAFEPEHIEVKIVAAKRKKPVFSESYAWASVIQ